MTLPFAATSSVRSMLDYLSSAPTFKNQWQAQHLKMGLWLLNPYGRTAWYILMSSVLFTWEQIAKFKKPSLRPSNIYYRDTPSMARGPDASSDENNIKFRDMEWVEEPDNFAADQDFWLGVLSHISRRMCSDVVTKFREFTKTYEFCQFVPLPTYKNRTRSGEVHMEIGVRFLWRIKWLLEQMKGKWRPVQLGAVFNENCNRFSLFYRYYVFCTTTGRDYLFYYKSSGTSPHQSLYAHIPAIENTQLLSRRDTRGVLDSYIKTVYVRMGKGERVECEASPQQDLVVMKKYWKLYHDA